MSDGLERVLLREVCEAPEEDGPRLVYADWCDDHDLPQRAEFIRLQVQRARLEPYDPRQLDLEDREKLLRSLFANAWQPEVPEEVRYFDGCFRRGFIALLERTADEWLADPGAWDAVTPVEGMWCRDVKDGAAVLRCPHLRRLRWLAMTFGPEGLRELPRSPHVGQLAFLDVTDERNLDDRGASQIAAADLPELEALEAKFANLTVAGLSALLTSPRLPKLRDIDVVYSQLGVAGVEQLATLPELTRLHMLNLQGCCPGPGGVSALAGSPFASELRDLRLACNQIGDEGLEALARSPHLANLAALGLYDNGLGPRSLAALLSSDLPRLLRVSLMSNPLGPDVGPTLAGVTEARGLRDLDLSSTDLGDEGVAALASCRALATLTRLDLGDNGITAVGARALADSPHLRNLTRLGLRGNKVRNDGVIALAASANVQHLRHLDLEGNEVRVLGARALARSPHLRNLEQLDLDSNPIGASGAQALADSPYLPGPPCFLLRVSHRTRVGEAGLAALQERWGDGVC